MPLRLPHRRQTRKPGRPGLHARTPDPRAWRRRGRQLLCVSVLLPLVLFASAAWYDHDAQLRQAQLRAAQTADALAEQAKLVLQTTDLVLARVLDRVGDKDWSTVGASRGMHDFLLAMQKSLPEVDSIFLVDPLGYNAASSRAFPMRRYDDVSREYFRAAVKGHYGLFVSAPFRSQVTGAPGFTVSRARLRNGSFDGLAAVTLRPGYFQGLYQAVLRAPGVSSADLVRDDGSLLVRYPQRPDQPLRLAQDGPLMHALASGAASGVYVAEPPAVARPELVAFRRVPGQDLVVTYGLDQSVYLTPWRQHVTVLAVFAFLVGLALFLTARATLARAAQEQVSLRRLLEETGRRQRAEAALHRTHHLQGLARLTGGVAHDFNNLLTAVLGALELASRRTADSRVQHLLAVATEAAQRGARLTTQMLAFSQHKERPPGAVAVNEVIRGTAEQMERTAGSLIRITYDLADDLWPACGDPRQLEMALLHLTMNARDAMPLGGTLGITATNVSLTEAEASPLGLAAGEYVCLTIADTGAGMAEEVRARAFDPFFTTKGPGRGTGLGLSMVYGFAAQAGGAATLDSRPGEGTTVGLFLPRARIARPVETLPPVAAPPVGQLSVLVVDDDDRVRETTAALLTEMGHTVTQAEGGRQALDLLRAAPGFDLLVADYAMPVMNGSMLAAEALRIAPALAVLFVTGYAEADALAPWADRGYPVLHKPFQSADLSAALRAAMVHAPQEKGSVVRLRPHAS